MAHFVLKNTAPVSCARAGTHNKPKSVDATVPVGKTAAGCSPYHLL